MYAGGVEVPIRVGADGSVEFYGEGLDVHSTDTRVYWLVEGDTAGLRTDAGAARRRKPDRRGAAAGGRVDWTGRPATGINVVSRIEPADGRGPRVLRLHGRAARPHGLLLRAPERRGRELLRQVVNTTHGGADADRAQPPPNDAQTRDARSLSARADRGRAPRLRRFNGATLGTLDFAGQTSSSPPPSTVEATCCARATTGAARLDRLFGDVSLTNTCA
jgi:hypothetical protein